MGCHVRRGPDLVRDRLRADRRIPTRRRQSHGSQGGQGDPARALRRCIRGRPCRPGVRPGRPGPSLPVAAQELAAGVEAADEVALEALGVAAADVRHGVGGLLGRDAEQAQRLLAGAAGESKVSRTWESTPAWTSSSRVLAVEGRAPGPAPAGTRPSSARRSARSRARSSMQTTIARASRRPGGVQDVEPRAVAVIDLEAELGRRLDHLDVVVDDRRRRCPRSEQRLAGDLAEAAEADDQHAARAARRRRRPRPATARRAARDPSVQR